MSTLAMKTITSEGPCAQGDITAFDTCVNTFLATVPPANLVSVSYKVIKGGSGDYLYCFVTYKQ